MEVVARKSFYKDAKKCPKHIQEKANEVIYDSGKCSKSSIFGIRLSKMRRHKKDENYYRIRVGDWRIGAELKYPQIIVITILSRGQVYKKFPPK